MQLGRVADLAKESFQHAAAVDEVAADDLEHLLPPHERVLRQIDHAHAALPQLAEDLVIGVIGEARRQAARRRRRRARIPAGQHRQSGGRRDEGSTRLGPAPGFCVAQPAEEAIRGELGDPAAGSPGTCPDAG